MSEEDARAFLTRLENVLSGETSEWIVEGINTNQPLAYPIKHIQNGHFVRIKVKAKEVFDINKSVQGFLHGKSEVLRFLVAARPALIPVREDQGVLGELRKEAVEHVLHAAPQAKVGIISEPETTPGVETPSEEEIDKRIEELLK
jgi:ribosomal protein S6